MDDLTLADVLAAFIVIASIAAMTACLIITMWHREKMHRMRKDFDAWLEAFNDSVDRKDMADIRRLSSEDWRGYSARA